MLPVIRFILVIVVVVSFWGCSTATVSQEKKAAVFSEQPKLQETQRIKNDFTPSAPIPSAVGSYSSGNTTINSDVGFIHKDRIANHSRLLATQIAINRFIQKTKGSGVRALPSSDQIQEWLYVLYKDALLSVALDGNFTEEVRQPLLSKIEEGRDEIDLMLLHSSNPYLDDVYLDRLRKVLNASFETESSSESTVSSAGMVLEIQDLLKRRKRYSDSYYKTEMKDYFQNDSVPLSDKITYFENFIITGDTNLVKYGAGYFEFLKEKGAVDPHEMQTIDDLLRRVEKQ